MFISIKCPSCGAMCDVDESRGFAFCSFCGTKMMNVAHKVEIAGSVRFDMKNAAQNLYLRGLESEKRGDTKSAEEYYNKALDLDIENQFARHGISRIKGLPTTENLFFTLGHGCAFEATVLFDGEKKMVAVGKPVFFFASAGVHTVRIEAFRNESISTSVNVDGENACVVFVIGYGGAGIKLSSGDISDLPEEYRKTQREVL